MNDWVMGAVIVLFLWAVGVTTWAFAYAVPHITYLKKQFETLHKLVVSTEESVNELEDTVYRDEEAKRTVRAQRRKLHIN